MITVLASLLLAFAADVKVDNDAVRVLSAADEPHKASALHKHDLNRVMIYMTAGDQTIRYQDGRVEMNHWKAGDVAWSPAGGMHISENTGSATLRIIEIELKRTAPPQPVRDPKLDPVAIDPSHNILIFENPQVRVFRSTREAGGTELTHEHTGRGRAGVFFTGLNATVKTGDGSTRTMPKISAGDVTWSDGPTTHATTNLGPDAMDMIVVEIK